MIQTTRELRETWQPCTRKKREHFLGVLLWSEPRESLFGFCVGRPRGGSVYRRSPTAVTVTVTVTVTVRSAPSQASVSGECLAMGREPTDEEMKTIRRWCRSKASSAQYLFFSL